MSTDLSIDASKGVQSLQELINKFNSLADAAGSLENSLNNKIISPLENASKAFERTTTSLSDLTSTLTGISSSVATAFDSFNTPTNMGDISAVEKLKTMIKRLSDLGAVDAGGGFSNIALSFQKLGDGLSKLQTNLDVNAVLGEVEKVSKIINAIGTVTQGQDGAATQIAFSDQSVEAVIKAGSALSSMATAIRKFPDLKVEEADLLVQNISKFRDSIFVLFSTLKPLFSGFIQETTFADGNVQEKQIESFASASKAVRAISEALNVFNKAVIEYTAYTTEDVAHCTSVIEMFQNSIRQLFDTLKPLFEGLIQETTFPAGNVQEKQIESFTSATKAVKAVSDALKVFNNSIIEYTAWTYDDVELCTSNLRKMGAAVSELFSTLKPFFKSLIQTTTFPGGASQAKQVESFESATKAVSMIAKSLTALTKSLSTVTEMNLSGFSAKITTITNSVKTIFEKLGALGRGSSVDGKFSFDSDFMNGFTNILKPLSDAYNVLSKLGNINVGNLGTDLAQVVDAIEVFINYSGQLARNPNYNYFLQLADAMDKVSRASKNLVGATEKTNKAVNKLSNTTKSTKSWFSKLTPTIRQFFTAFAGYNIIHAVTNSIKASFREFIKLETAMARVNTIARASKIQLKEYTQQIYELSTVYGKSPLDLAGALYDINSATITGSDAMKVLKASTRAAVAGFTDVSKVANLVAETINAFGYNAGSAEEIVDTLFKTVEKGINPMEQLTQYLGRLLTVSAQAGLTFNEINAAVATLTSRGLQTNIAITSLNSAILKLSQGNKQLNTIFRNLGYESSASALRYMGLQKVLEVLRGATGGLTNELVKLKFNYRDIRAITVLSSVSLRAYADTLKYMTEASRSASSTQQAINTVMETTEQKWNQFRQNLTATINKFLEQAKASDVLRASLDGLNKVLVSIQGGAARGSSDGGSWFTSLLQTGAIVAAAIGLKKLVSMSKIAGSKLSKLTPVFRMLNTSATAFGKSILFAFGRGVANVLIGAWIGIYNVFYRVSSVIKNLIRMFSLFRKGGLSVIRIAGMMHKSLRFLTLPIKFNPWVMLADAFISLGGHVYEATKWAEKGLLTWSDFGDSLFSVKDAILGMLSVIPLVNMYNWEKHLSKPEVDFSTGYTSFNSYDKMLLNLSKEAKSLSEGFKNLTPGTEGWIALEEKVKMFRAQVAKAKETASKSKWAEMGIFNPKTFDELTNRLDKYVKKVQDARKIDVDALKPEMMYRESATALNKRLVDTIKANSSPMQQYEDAFDLLEDKIDELSDNKRLAKVIDFDLLFTDMEKFRKQYVKFATGRDRKKEDIGDLNELMDYYDDMMKKQKKVNNLFTSFGKTVSKAFETPLTPLQAYWKAFTDNEKILKDKGFADFYKKMQEGISKGTSPDDIMKEMTSTIQPKDLFGYMKVFEQYADNQNIIRKFQEDTDKQRLQRYKDAEKALHDYDKSAKTVELSLLPKPLQILEFKKRMMDAYKEVTTAFSQGTFDKEAFDRFKTAASDLRGNIRNTLSFKASPEIKTARAVEYGSDAAFEMIYKQISEPRNKIQEDMLKEMKRMSTYEKDVRDDLRKYTTNFKKNIITNDTTSVVTKS